MVPVPELYDVSDSPFVELATPFTSWEALKLVLLPTVPLRLIMYLLASICVVLVNSAAVHGCDLERPLPPWRRRWVQRASQSYCGVVLHACGFWSPRVIGLHNYERGRELGAIGVFNHVSYLDAWVLVWACCCSGVTFTYATRVPILAPAVRALQNIYVPESPHKAVRGSGMAAAIRQRAANRCMPMLSVAPEGMLSHGRCLLSFRSGAFVAGAPVVPILLRYRQRSHNPAWTIITGWWHLLRMLCQFDNDVTVEMLPPYVPSAAEVADPALYAANVRKHMAAALGVPLVDQDRSHYLALVNAGVRVSWDGRRVLAPPGVLDKQGRLDLAPYMPGVYVRPPRGGGGGSAEKAS